MLGPNDACASTILGLTRAMDDIISHRREIQIEVEEPASTMSLPKEGLFKQFLGTKHCLWPDSCLYLDHSSRYCLRSAICVLTKPVTSTMLSASLFCTAHPGLVSTRPVFDHAPIFHSCYTYGSLAHALLGALTLRHGGIRVAEGSNPK